MLAAADLPPLGALPNPPALIAKAKLEMRQWGNVRLSDASGFKKVITSCLDVEGYTHIDVENDVLDYLGYRENPKTLTLSPPLDFDKDIKITILQQPKHGVVGTNLLPNRPAHGYKLSDRNPDGRASYQGWDKVVYQVEVKGQKFKVIVNLLSVGNADTIGGQICERTRISLSGGSSGDVDAWLRSAQLSALLSSASQSLTGFSDLPGTAVGETTGEGATAAITLDTTAAGHGWYVDPTPLDNTDD